MDYSGWFLVYFDSCIVALATICNIIAFPAIMGSNFQLTGYRHFLLSLTAANFYVCLVNVVVLIYGVQLGQNLDHENLGSLAQFHRCFPNVLRTMKLFGFVVNLLNLCGLSFCHLLGVLYPIRYRYFIDKKLARLLIIGIWCSSAFIGLANLAATFVPQPHEARPIDSDDLFYESSGLMDDQEMSFSNMSYFYDHVVQLNTSRSDISHNDSSVDLKTTHQRNNSETISSLIDIIAELLGEEEKYNINQEGVCTKDMGGMHGLWFEISVIGLACFSFAFLVFCYTIIFRKVSHRLDIPYRQSRKLVMTTILFLCVFAVGWLPCMIFELSVLLHFRSSILEEQDLDKKASLLHSLLLIGQVLNSIMMCYPLVDPIIYIARLPGCRKIVLEKVTRFGPQVCTKLCPASDHETPSSAPMLTPANSFVLERLLLLAPSTRPTSVTSRQTTLPSE